MVADHYFDLRSRLGAALFSLGSLADAAGLKPSRTPVIKSLVEGLRDPFVFVVAGEVNAGKSTLLNALFGEEFCATGVLPETRRIHYFRYHRTPQRMEAGPLLEEIGLPHAFLRDFHIVDTPGVNSIAEGHEQITGEFIPRADAVVYCFPAVNPWSSAAWDFLGRIHHGWLRKIVLVLQQADLRTPAETAAIAEHLRSIGRQRLGADLPVFPVSARLALLARTSGVDKPRLLAESGFPAFEAELTRMVAGTAARFGKLVGACSAGQALLAEVQAKLAAGATAAEELKQLQENVRTTMAAAAAGVRRQAETTAQSLREAWNTTMTQVPGAAVAERLPFPRLLVGRDPTAGTIESRLLPPLLTAVRDAADAFECFLDDTMTSLWKQPGSTLHRALEGRVRRPPEPGWPSRGGIFPASLENTACDAVAASGLASFWQDRLRHRRGMVRGLFLLVFLVAAVGLGGIGSGALPLPATAAGLGAVVVAAVAAGRSLLRREAAATAALVEPLCTAAGDLFAVGCLRLVTVHGERRIRDFAPFLTPLESLIQQKEETSVSLAGEAAVLACTLQTLAKSLQGTAPQSAAGFGSA